MASPFHPSLFEYDANCGQSIVVAVSGGGDSMALLDLYRLAFAQNANLPRPSVVSVDHGLRSGFAAEAAIVEAYCQSYGLPWQLVHWQGEKPKTGIMAAARLERYRLLADAAKRIGATRIVTGHTLDDQNETMAMRAMRGVGSPMECSVLFERQVLISRPLLTISRAELRAHLTHANIAFAEDPTNSDIRFERARVRHENGTAIFAPSIQVSKADLVVRAAGFILQNVKTKVENILILRPHTRDTEAETLALRYLAATLGQFEYPAPANTGKLLVDLLNEGQRSFAFTAQRCTFMRVDNGVLVKRDARHKAKTLHHSQIFPFETFCAQSMLPLANALAEVLIVPRFILPGKAAI